MNKINKTTTKFFSLLWIPIVFLGGCNNLVENTSTSSLLRKQEIETSMTDVKQSNREMLNDVQVSFSLVDSQVVLHEPVLLNFVIQNNLAQTVKLDLGQNFKEGFLFTVVFPDRRRVQLPPLTVDEGISQIGNVLLKPQQTYAQKILLNEWVDFSSAGKYIIEGQLANPFKTGDEKVLATNSNFSITLDMQPRNAKHLNKISSSLVQRITQSNNYAENAETALALSYIDDPVAVPYLVNLLTSNKMVESVIINTLRKIGSKNSVEVLIRVINEKLNSSLAVSAKSALKWIENKSPDLEVKQMINQFLRSKL